jgi:hypothetical protein
MPPPVTLTIQNQSHHLLEIRPTSSRQNDWRRPPSKNRQVTSSEILRNANTGNFSLLLSGFFFLFWGIDT